MLGYESERRLKNFIVAIGEGEHQLERARQRLCEIRDMAPYQLFQRLDRDANDSVSSYELLNFIRDNGVYAQEPECYELVKFFDSNEDGRLTYQEFLQMILPCEDNLLRRIATERTSYRCGRYDNLPRDIEKALTDIIERELALLKKLDMLKRDLQSRYDYTAYAAYRSLDKYNDGHIDTYSLGQFLKNNGSYQSERELLSIIRRIDTDGDAKLSYEEFSEFLRISYPSSHFDESLKNRSQSEERNRKSLQASATVYNSPLRARSTYNSPQRNHSASHNNRGSRVAATYATPERSSPLKESSGFSGLKVSQIRDTSPIRNKQPVLRLEEEDELVRALKEQISLERELENAKISMIQKPDFNVFDAFRIFDIDSRGWISHSDLKLGLNEIGVFPGHDEVDLYFKRYDKDLDGRIKFSEFCDSFSPIDNYYGTLLNRRTSNNTRGRLYARDDCFLGETKLEFKSLWRTHFKIEVYSEQLRQRLSKRPAFNVYDAFITCDLNDNGSVSKEELRSLIESRGFYVSEKEVHSLVEKIDKDKDGRITYSEFREEFMPKSPVRM